MKNKVLFLGSLFLVGMVMYACMKDTGYAPAPEPAPGGFTIAQARTFFESTAPGLRTLDLKHDLSADTIPTRSLLDLDAGILIPDWETAFTYENSFAENVELMIRSTELHLAHQQEFPDADSPDSILSETKVYHKLIVEKRFDDPTVRYYVATVIPSPEYMKGRTEKDLATLRHRPLVEEGFDGIIFYSFVSGQVIRGHRYKVGVLTHHIYPTWMIEKKGLQEKVHIRYRFGFVNISTKGGGDQGGEGWTWCICGNYHYWWEDCEGTIITEPDPGGNNGGEDPFPWPDPDPDPWPEDPDPGVDPFPEPPGDDGGGSEPGNNDGGGNDKGNDNNNDNQNKTEEQKKQEDKEKLEDEKDCDEQAIRNSQNAQNSYSAFQNVGVQNNFISLHQNASIEWASTLNLNSTGYWMSDPVPGPDDGRSVTPELWNTSVAAIHNHPNNSPPSMGDALALADYYERTDGSFKTIYAITPDGTLYALQIEDGTKAKNFFNYYRQKKDELDNQVQSFYNMMRREFFYPDDYRYDLQMYAMAQALDNYATGITLQRMDNGRFIQKDAGYEAVDGSYIMVRSTCKY